MTVEAEYTEVTPDMAAKWLRPALETGRNVGRIKVTVEDENGDPARRHLVEVWADKMSGGDWAEVSAGAARVIFDEDGVLRDGRAVLAAVILAGRPVRLMVIKGVPAESAGMLDAAVARISQRNKRD